MEPTCLDPNKAGMCLVLVVNFSEQPVEVRHNVVAASFFPAQVSSIQLARDIEFSIFAEVERLV